MSLSNLSRNIFANLENLYSGVRGVYAMLDQVSDAIVETPKVRCVGLEQTRTNSLKSFDIAICKCIRGLLSSCWCPRHGCYTLYCIFVEARRLCMDFFLVSLEDGEYHIKKLKQTIS